MNLYAYTDGASRNNPGEAGIGVVIKKEDGTTLSRLKKYIGTSTNNAAEYTALIHCLENVPRSGDDRCSLLVIHTDSELMARQMDGTYRIKDLNLKQLHAKAKELIDAAPFQCVIKHVPRAMNAEADALANDAIDSRS
jgi:ribonuclease HI